MSLDYMKFLTEDGRGPYSGMRMPIGEWLSVAGELEMCVNGFHAATPRNAIEWVNARCHLVEIRGDRIDSSGKVCVREINLGPALDTWNERTARLLAADFAESVLHIFEDANPGDDRPREAIQVARAFAVGKVGDSARRTAWAAAGRTARAAAWAAAGDAAWAAAWAAAGDAAWAAARDAAKAAAWAASGAAAWAAAGAAARRTARDAQSHRLHRVLLGEITYDDDGVPNDR